MKFPFASFLMVLLAVLLVQQAAVSQVANEAVTANDAPTATDTIFPSIAVMDFSDPADLQDMEIGKGITEIITSMLVQDGRVVVIETDENPDDEENSTGHFDSAVAVKIGLMYGVDYVLTGTVTEFSRDGVTGSGYITSGEGSGERVVSNVEAYVRLDYMLIDTETGEAVLASSSSGEESGRGEMADPVAVEDMAVSIVFDSDEFRESAVGVATIEAVDNLMGEITGYFPLQCRIMAVSEEFIILDIGFASGIETGFEFDVYRVSEVLNSAGEVVWDNREIIGRLRVTELERTTAKAEILSGQGFAEDDICVISE